MASIICFGMRGYGWQAVKLPLTDHFELPSPAV
jgi:hypothetical protein